jgi:ABC-type nitrate/sulfonate/bicarbonate transport system permease component
MIAKIYLPAMRPALLNSLRLGFGVAFIGVLLAETKLSNRGVGFLVIQSYTHFEIARMFALLICVFALAAVVNAALSVLLRSHDPAPRSM